MAFSPAPLLVQLPSYLKSELVIITDQLVDSTTCPDPIPLNQIAIPRPLHDLKTNTFWDGPLSPCTVQNILVGLKNLWHPPNYKHLLQALPPPYSRERRSITVRPTTSGSTSPTSMPSAELSNNVIRILMESHCYDLMDLRTIMEDSPHLLSLVQMGTVLLSSSSN